MVSTDNESHQARRLRNMTATETNPTETGRAPAVIGSTVFLDATGAGVGADLDRAVSIARDNGEAECGRVVVCGGAPRMSVIPVERRQWETWLNTTRGWAQLDRPYIGATAIRARFGDGGGRTITVGRAAQWFGDAAPGDVCEATKHVRQIVGATGATMTGSPSRTGLAMLHAIWHRQGVEFEPQPEPVQQLIRSTSGQGRFELLPRGRERGGRQLVAVDARFQYAAIASAVSLPVGDPQPVRAGDQLDRYACGWVHVRFTANDAIPFGLLPVMKPGSDRAWHYPAAGTHDTWATWSEIELATDHGYRVTVLGGYWWPSTGRPLRGWADRLIRERDRITGRPVSTSVADAVRAALRNITIQTIGMMHGRDTIEQHTVTDSIEIPDDAVSMRPISGGFAYEVRRPAAWRSNDSHPEWTAQIWGLARRRLAQRMLDDPRHVVAVALDSVVYDRTPTDTDTGRAGGWRPTRTAGRWQALTSMSDVYAALGSS
jgi:hypothetical protein